LQAGSNSDPIHEVEVELRHGDARAVFAVARQIAKRVPLRLQVLSKPERGHRLIENAAEAAENARQVSLVPDVSA
uniref:hypothetical protein n=1 Tax=Acinetobacter baumannii TaxID=470 RepID=UPI003F684D09